MSQNLNNLENPLILKILILTKNVTQWGIKWDIYEPIIY
jgi:hypothetical protein